MDLDTSGLLSVIKEASKPKESTQSAVVIGTVLSTEPFKVQVGELIVPSSLLLVSPFVKDLTFSESSLLRNHTHPSVHGQTDNAQWSGDESLLWHGVHVGEQVVLLRMGQGQQFLVLYPVSGIHTEGGN